MKLPLLLTQFLYHYKRLNLPGIGSFVLDPSAIIPEEHPKDQHSTVVGIEFKNTVILEPDDDLIEFIKVHTGKMKPLALADLDSYLTLGTELVNIGKPFYLEGIGTLTKNKEGKFDFKPGEYSTIRFDEPGSAKTEKRDKGEYGGHEPGNEYEPRSNRMRKILLLLSIIGGLVIIGWGGYMMYVKNTPETGAQTNENSSVVPPKDSVAGKSEIQPNSGLPADTPQSKSIVHSASLPPARDSILYKFNLLETYNKARALKRYNQLLDFQLKIHMYTKDSTFFKVYFAFRALPKDTVHIKDSLSREYGHKIYIER